MVKLSAGLGGGNQQQSRQGGPLRTVGGRVLDGGLVAALALGDKGGGAAAVAVEHVRAPQFDHHGGQLVYAHTGGYRLLAAVVDHQHQAAVGLQAQHRAGCAAAGGMILGGIQAHTVPDDVAPCGDGVQLGAVQRLAARADGCLAAAVDHQVIVAVGGVIVIHLAVDDQHARRIVGGPGEVDVGGAHDVIAQGLCRSNLLAHHLIAPIGLCHRGVPAVQLHILIAGHHGYIGIAQICFQHMAYVLIRACAVVENDLLLRDARRNLIVLLGDHGVVRITLGLGCGFALDGQHRQQHTQCQRSRQDTSPRLVGFQHVLSPFIQILFYPGHSSRKKYGYQRPSRRLIRSLKDSGHNCFAAACRPSCRSREKNLSRAAGRFTGRSAALLQASACAASISADKASRAALSHRVRPFWERSSTRDVPPSSFSSGGSDRWRMPQRSPSVMSPAKCSPLKGQP